MNDDNDSDAFLRVRRIPLTTPPLMRLPPRQRNQDEEVNDFQRMIKMDEEWRLKQLVLKPREQLVSQCRGYIRMICENCGFEGSGKRPLNIVIVGAQGEFYLFRQLLRWKYLLV